MKWFLSPYDKERVFGRLLTSTNAVVFRLLSHVFGREFLDDLAEYFQHFRDCTMAFASGESCGGDVHDRKRTSFLIVCAPNGPSSEVRGSFSTSRNRRMPNPGVIVNQRHLTLGTKLDALGAGRDPR